MATKSLANLHAPIFKRNTNVSAHSVSWKRLFKNSLSLRLRKAQFEKLSNQLYSQCPIAGQELVDLLLNCQDGSGPVADPLVSTYLESLLISGKIDAAHVLDGLYIDSRYSQLSVALEETVQRKRTRKMTNDLDSRTFIVLLRHFIVKKLPTSPEEARGVLQSLSKWMLAVSSFHVTLMQVLDPDALATCDGLGMLIISVLENTRMIGLIDHACSKVIRKELYEALTTFIPFWTQCASPSSVQNVNRLAIAFKSRAILEEKLPAGSEDPNMDAVAALQIDNIPDLAIVNNRASLFIFLSSLLFARPIADDIFIMQYLQAKYKVNMQFDVESLAIDLILSSFDLLSCAMTRKETSSTLFVLKSFLINKVPIILTALSASMFSTDRSEVCIGQAMALVDKDLFPSMAIGGKSILQDLREEFLFSCVLHSLLRADNVQSLLGEPPLSSPPDPMSRYTKEILVDRCANDPERAVQLVDELEKLDGNGGAISLALTEIIRNLSLKSSPDTTTIKTLCIALSGKPRSTDVLFQFVSPAALLQTICQVLDNWRYDEETEYQPSYEEFSSIFLLVLAAVHRYDLSAADLNILQDTFVAKYLKDGHNGKHLESFTEEELKKLSTWIKILFNSESISDELLSTCTPQEFYLLVPTMFSQIIFAQSAQIFPSNALNTPFEYLQEPFLVPSLVGAVEWMLIQGWKRKDVSIIVPLLMRIVKKTDSSNTQKNTVTSIIGESTARFLRRWLAANSKGKSFTPQHAAVFEAEITRLDQQAEPRMTIYHPYPELQAFRSTHMSVKAALRNMLQSLMDWGSTLTINPMQRPPNYTPRTLHIAIAVMGARTVLVTILEELKTHMRLPDTSGPIALDIFTTLICSPVPGSRHSPTDWMHTPFSTGNGRLTLREALKLEFEEATKLIQSDQLMAECVVRLYRRVEAQLSMILTNIADLPAPLLPELSAMADDAAAAVDLAAVADAVEGMDFTTDPGLGLSMDLDPTTAGSGMDLLGSGGGLGGEEDIFADLMSGSLGDMQFDGFD